MVTHLKGKGVNLSRPNNTSYRGPGGSYVGKPMPWTAFLALASKGASAGEVKEWFDSLRDNEKVDARAGVKQIMELAAYCVSVDVYSLTGATATLSEIERDLDRLGVAKLQLAVGVYMPQGVIPDAVKRQTEGGL